MLIHRLSSIAVAAILAAPLAAQQVRCAVGPGAAFGIVSYQCANCGYRNEPGRRPVYSFYAEPVVTEVSRNSVVVTGDVIEAVNGQPITTQSGADQFAYPTATTNTLTVRRGRERKTLEVSGLQRAACAGPGLPDDFGVPGSGARAGGGSGSGGGFGRAGGAGGAGGGGFGSGRARGQVLTGDTLAVTNSPTTSRFGFGVECHPSCSMKRMPNGEFYYKYDGYPSIVAVREGTAADRAGLHVGDVVMKVNGRSILDEAGALQIAEQQEQIRLTVRRDGKDIDVLMLVTR
jgi:hypothetical protein